MTESFKNKKMKDNTSVIQKIILLNNFTFCIKDGKNTSYSLTHVIKIASLLAINRD